MASHWLGGRLWGLAICFPLRSLVPSLVSLIFCDWQLLSPILLFLSWVLTIIYITFVLLPLGGLITLVSQSVILLLFLFFIISLWYLNCELSAWDGLEWYDLWKNSCKFVKRVIAKHSEKTYRVWCKNWQIWGWTLVKVSVDRIWKKLSIFVSRSVLRI